jgi:hypothetical protein
MNFFADPAIVEIYSREQLESELHEKVKLPLLKVFNQSKEDYLRQKEKLGKMDISKQKINMEIKKLKKKSAYCHGVVRLINSLQDGLISFIYQIRPQFPAIFQVLNKTFTLKVLTQEIVSLSTPITDRSISGLYWNLRQHYSTATPNTLISAYMDILTPLLTVEEFLQTPTDWLNSLYNLHNKWKKEKIFKLFTEDMLWSLWTIRGIPIHPATVNFRREMNKTFNAALKLLRSPQAQLTESSLSVSSKHHDNLPVYHIMCERAEEYLTKEWPLEFENSSIIQPNSYAMVTVPVSPTLQTPKVDLFANLKPLPEKKFTSDVPAESKFFTVFNNYKSKYTATQEQCKKCHGNSQNRCRPKCLRLKCNKCSKFGHHNSICHQHIT